MRYIRPTAIGAPGFRVVVVWAISSDGYVVLIRLGWVEEEGRGGRYDCSF